MRIKPGGSLAFLTLISPKLLNLSRDDQTRQNAPSDDRKGPEIFSPLSHTGPPAPDAGVLYKYRIALSRRPLISRPGRTAGAGTTASAPECPQLPIHPSPSPSWPEAGSLISSHVGRNKNKNTMGIVRAADDVEAGVVGAATTTEPLLLRHCHGSKEEDHQESKIQGSPEEAASDCGSEGRPDAAGSLRMVLLSTAVAVCGSFEFGTCVRTRRHRHCHLLSLTEFPSFHISSTPVTFRGKGTPCTFAFHVLNF